MDIFAWKDNVIREKTKKAIPVLSFPCCQLLGVTVKELVENSDLQAEGMKLIADKYDFGAAVSMMDLSVEAEAFGSKVAYYDNEVPTVVGAIIEEPEDLESLHIPEVGEGRTGLYIDAIRKAKQLITDRPVFAGIIGPFSLAGRLMGMSEIMINCYEEPEMVEETLNIVTDFLINYALAYKEAGADGIVMAEPATGLLSPQMASEFSVPYVKRIVDQVQDGNFGVVFHNCGGSAPLMIDEIVASGAIAYHFGDSADMEDVCKKMPGDVLVMGNISPSRLFRAGSPEKVQEATLDLLRKCSSYPNFVISSGCDIPPASSFENIDAFYEAVKTLNA